MENKTRSYKEMVDTSDIKIVIEMLGYVTSMVVKELLRRMKCFSY